MTTLLVVIITVAVLSAMIGFTVLSEGFPRELTARANTALNLLMFGGSFAMQWGIGLFIDAARLEFGTDTTRGLQLAFASVLGINIIAYAWFGYGWRRHAVVVAA